MHGYEKRTYGERWVDLFKDVSESADASTQRVNFLAGLADGGRVVEFGIGSGRIALELADFGIDIHGIDVSLPMLQALRARQQGRKILAWCADMVTFSARCEYSVIYIIGNAFFMLLTVQEQQSCLHAAYSALRPDGKLVIETTMPDLAIFQGNGMVRVDSMELDRVDLLVAVHDRDHQSIAYQRVQIDDQGIRLRPLVYRYSTPQQIDEMASEAGLTLMASMSDWSGTPHQSENRKRIACYKRPATLT